MKDIGYLKLKVNGYYYIYDTTTNALINVEEPVYHILDDYLISKNIPVLYKKYGNQMSADDISRAVNYIDSIMETVGMFQPHIRKDYTAILNSKKIEKLFSNNLKELFLNVTDQCNQRCSYCSFSGNYIGERTHRDVHMVWSIARNSIDYFLRGMRKHEETWISFYGGEPLFKWALVKKSIEYIKNKNSSPHLNIQLISNLTLCSDEILEFLMANDVHIQASLDGPQSIHDAARVTRNGRGTHKRVVDILRKIKKRNPDYYYNKVALHCTFNMNNDLLEVFRFFNNELFNGLIINVGGISERDTRSYPILDENIDKHRSNLDALVNKYLNSLRNNKKRFNYNLFSNLFPGVFDLARRRVSIQCAESHPNGICIPGIRRIFVSSEGFFYPCEKFNPKGYEIGDHETGLDIEKIMKLLEMYVEICDKMCQDCWAYRLCSHCFVSLLEKGTISKKRKMEDCRIEKEIIKKSFERFVYLWLNEPNSALNNKFSLHSRVKQFQSGG